MNSAQNGTTNRAYRSQSATSPARRTVILVANSKGGCGKTTVSTNLACYYEALGRHVTLMDLDPQQSSSQWLKLRKTDYIHSLAWPAGEPLSLGRLQQRLDQCGDVVIIDSPAGLDAHQLDHLMRLSQIVLVPVLPSPIDIRATTRFLQNVMLTPSYRRRPRRLAVIANRVRTRTRMYEALRQFLASLKIPYLVTLRDTQSYVQAMSHGEGIMDAAVSRHMDDKQHWRLIGEWLEVQRHLIQTMPGFR
ncbi:ParA family protein [Alcanivorax sp. S6407]|uniref:ParA family protein n=1 Tax=Alcanivorax sp. S6407 TaxID=2926424 RepID=UPI001FF225E4|nr:ParA family protein [Alcanivorax sp. S6407]MCK0154762.1 ParA family protein [Alcanivorax sp. S6407]